MSRRVVVTGVGLISPLGIGTKPTWDGLVAGTSGASTITRFDTTDYSVHIAAEVKGFEPTDWIEHKEVKKFDMFVHYALAASQMALENSGFEITDENATRVGVVIGSGIGGLSCAALLARYIDERKTETETQVLAPAKRKSARISIRKAEKRLKVVERDIEKRNKANQKVLLLFAAGGF